MNEDNVSTPLSDTSRNEDRAYNILVLEDDPSLAEIIEHKFVMKGFEVEVARNVDEALFKMERDNVNVDVIWLDHYLLGKANGLDFVVMLKNHEEWRNIPIFVVSNSSSGDSIQSYMRLGVTQYYTKSDYDLSQIVEDVLYALQEETSGSSAGNA